MFVFDGGGFSTSTAWFGYECPFSNNTFCILIWLVFRQAIISQCSIGDSKLLRRTSIIDGSNAPKIKMLSVKFKMNNGSFVCCHVNMSHLVQR